MLCANIGDFGAKLGNHPPQVSKTTEKVPSAMGSLPPGRAGSAFAYSRSGEGGFDICWRLFCAAVVANHHGDRSRLLASCFKNGSNLPIGFPALNLRDAGCRMRR